MTRAVTLAELRQRSLRAAEMQTLNANQHVPVDEVNALINESVSELHDILVLRYDDYFVRSANLASTVGVADSSLPTDFYKLRGVQLFAGPAGTGQCLGDLGPFSESERACLQAASGGFPKYQLNDGVITILPANGTGSYVLRYIYQAPYLSVDTDTLSYQIVPGWEAYVVNDVAVQLLSKVGRDPTTCAARRDRLTQRLTEVATRRDAGRPGQIVDVYGWSSLR